MVGLLVLGLVVPVLAMGEKAPTAKTTAQFTLPQNGLPSVVKLGAEWCSPCRAMKPVLKELSAELKGKVNVLDIDIEEHRDLARQYKVRLIPTTILLDRNGKTKATITGFISKEDLRGKLKELGLL
jgi:thioredoxin 1